MLDFFAIFSKSGIVLWCFQGTSQIFTPSVNALIRSVLLQERGSNSAFTYEGLTLKYKLDNEFELVFVVAYQKILQLAYIDKFLDDVHLEFRDKYKDDLQVGNFFSNYQFTSEFQKILKLSEEYGKVLASQPKKMKSYEESLKSKKTVASMIENKKDAKEASNKKASKESKNASKAKGAKNEEQIKNVLPPMMEDKNEEADNADQDEIMRNMQKLIKKNQGKGKKPEKLKSPSSSKDKSKKPRKWDNGGSSKDIQTLDFSKKGGDNIVENGTDCTDDYLTAESRHLVGTMQGSIQSMECSDSEIETDDDEEEEEKVISKNTTKGKSPKGFGMFSMFRGLVGSKSITREDMESILSKLKDHMIAKNVATDISEKLCESLVSKLEGKVIGTFTGVASIVKATLVESLVQLLSPKRRIDILRDVIEAKKHQRPYTITFCGVNGVGKSTNLAKIAFWLIENHFCVLIAACDTFRAGAVEQLRTHTRHLNALHPPEKHNNRQMVQLYEKGYGKEAAGIAMEAINFARDTAIDVVLIDTAGRMQDNEPLMRALAKLIKVNSPDLVLFVGEALVGNEAVDQLVKFNRALADHSKQENPHLIDGIVLTKFDTIDDKVGAAVSMTYITGQPIIFVGTGQTYMDLKALNAKAVVHALMK